MSSAFNTLELVLISWFSDLFLCTTLFSFLLSVFLVALWIIKFLSLLVAAAMALVVFERFAEMDLVWVGVLLLVAGRVLLSVVGLVAFLFVVSVVTVLLVAVTV